MYFMYVLHSVVTVSHWPKSVGFGSGEKPQLRSVLISIFCQCREF